MPLMEHIRELRNRVVKVTIAVTVGSIIGWFFYPHVWHFIQAPVLQAPAAARGFRASTDWQLQAASCTSTGCSTRSS